MMMKKAVSNLLLVVGMCLGIGCAGPGGSTHQTSTPPPPVPGSSDTNARPVIYDSTLPTANSPAPSAQSPLAGDAAPATSTLVPYTVQPGDSLWKIANTQRSSVAKIRAANNLTGDVIRPGQVLQIPVP